jgi:hypothetical protein
MANLSRTALLEFIDYLANKGLMNKTTASARKAAANRVLGILDDAEANDVSKIDLDEVMTRFHNLEGAKFTPDSLNTYKSRLKSAIEDFVRYQRDPLNFRPTTQNTGRRLAERQKPAGNAETSRKSVNPPVASAEAPPASVSILPIPIRPDLTIKIQGLPYDLTPQEALKIANVVRAMAVSD